MNGASIHWEPAHVKPLPAFQTSACNDGWDEASGQARTSLGLRYLERRHAHQRWRSEQRFRPPLVRHWFLTHRSSPRVLRLNLSPNVLFFPAHLQPIPAREK
jgi:hypothetical protein